MFALSDLYGRMALDAGFEPGAGAGVRWRVRLLGAVDAVAVAAPAPAGTTQSRWPTRAVAALLARLALGPDRLHPREELVELLWPGVSLSVGRNRLRQALSALKALLESRDAAVAPVLMADHFAIRVAPGALACDVLDFERCLRSGRVEAARALYRGDLMPGHYDEWVLDERRRLAALRERLGSADPLLPHRALPQRASLHL